MTTKTFSPDADVKKIWRLVLNIFSLFFMGMLIIAALFGLPLSLLAIFFLLYIALVYLPIMLYLPAYYKSLKYQLFADHIQIHKGVFWKRRTSIPYSKITNIDITEGPFERLYHLSSMHLQTAGSNAAEAAKAEGVLVGIKNSEDLRNFIQNQLNMQTKSAVAETEKTVLQEILAELRKLTAEK